MHTSPARAPRGDPDMTRRLPDRAHVRRQGQTRCYVERYSPSVEQPADLDPVLSSLELNPVGSALEPQVYERLRGDPDNTALAWSSVEHTDQTSPGRPSRSTPEPVVPVLASSPREPVSCACRLSMTYISPRYKLKDEHFGPYQPDQAHNIANPHKPFETGGTAVLAAKPFHRYRFEEQVSRPNCEQSRTTPTQGPRRLFLPPSLLLLYLLLLLPKSIVAKPAAASEEESPHQFVLRTPLCEPVSREDLMKMLGPYYDPSRMAADEATARRNRLSNYFDHSSTAGFQGDDPRATRVPGSDSLVQEEIIYASEEDSEWDDEDDGKLNDKRVWIKDVEDLFSGEAREEIVEEDEESIEDPHSSKRFDSSDRAVEFPGKYKHKHRQHRADVVDSREYHPRHRISTDNYAYMKRRRRKRSSENSRNRDALPRRNEYVNSKNNVSSHGSRSNNSNSNWARSDSFRGARRRGRYAGANNKWQRKEANTAEDMNSKDKQSDIGLLPLQIAASKRPDRKLRKYLKQKFRQNAQYLSKRKPPWQCKMTTKTLLMDEGVFPRVIVNGNCGENRKCFYRLYNCEPQRYNIKIMQRDKDHCNPLPRVGNTTVFEERWKLVSKQITVGCNCVNAPLKRRKSNKKWRSTRRKN